MAQVFGGEVVKGVWSDVDFLINKESVGRWGRNIMKVRAKSSESSVSDGGNFYQFQFEPCHIEKGRRGQKIFVCDICRGVFKRSFSLKRHYLRFHINYAFLSPRDLNNCAIVTTNHRAVASQSCNDEPSVAKKSNLLYRCHQCGYLVASKADLLCHLETHPTTEGGEEYVNGVNRCPRCSTAFTLRKTLRRHIKKNRCRNANPPSRDEATDDLDSTANRPASEESLPDELAEVDESEEMDMEASLKLGCSTSLFRFACTLCSRMFQTYVNMCRHRRLAHGRFGICSPNLLVSRNKSKSCPSRGKTVTAKNLLNAGSSGEPFKDFTRIVEENLNHFIDGKRIHLATVPVPAENGELTNGTDQEPVSQGPHNERWTWGSTDYNIHELMRLDIPVQQAFFRGLSRWRPDEMEIASPDSSQASSNPCFASSVLGLRPVETISKCNVTEQLEFSGEWTRLKSYICAPCGQVFQDFYVLRSHQMDSHSNVLFRHIELDDTRESVMEELKKQVRFVHQEPQEDTSHQCTKCQVNLSSIPDLHNHILQCSNHAASSPPRKRRSRLLSNSRRNQWQNSIGGRSRGMKRSLSSSSKTTRSLRSRSPKTDPLHESNDDTTAIRRRSARRILNFNESPANRKSSPVKRVLRRRPDPEATSSGSHQVENLGDVRNKSKKDKAGVKESNKAKIKTIKSEEICKWCGKKYQTKKSRNRHCLTCPQKPDEQIIIVCDMAADYENTSVQGTGSQQRGRPINSSLLTKIKQEPPEKRSDAKSKVEATKKRKRGAEALKEEILSKANKSMKSEPAASSQQPKGKKTANRNKEPSISLTSRDDLSVRTRAHTKENQRNDSHLSPKRLRGHSAARSPNKSEATASPRKRHSVAVPPSSESPSAVNGRLRSKSASAKPNLKSVSVPRLGESKTLPDMKTSTVVAIKKVVAMENNPSSSGCKSTKELKKSSTSTSDKLVSTSKSISAPSMTPSPTKKRKSAAEETPKRSLRSRQVEPEAPAQEIVVDVNPKVLEETPISARPIRSSRRSFSSLVTDSFNTEVEKSFLEALLPEQRLKIAEQTCPFCSKRYVYKSNFKKHLLEGCDSTDLDETSSKKIEDAKVSASKSGPSKPSSGVGLKVKQAASTPLKASPKSRKEGSSSQKKREMNQRRVPGVDDEEEEEMVTISSPICETHSTDQLRIQPIQASLECQTCDGGNVDIPEVIEQKVERSDDPSASLALDLERRSALSTVDTEEKDDAAMSPQLATTEETQTSVPELPDAVETSIDTRLKEEANTIELVIEIEDGTEGQTDEIVAEIAIECRNGESDSRDLIDTKGLAINGDEKLDLKDEEAPEVNSSELNTTADVRTTSPPDAADPQHDSNMNFGSTPDPVSTQNCSEQESQPLTPNSADCIPVLNAEESTDSPAMTITHRVLDDVLQPDGEIRDQNGDLQNHQMSPRRCEIEESNFSSREIENSQTKDPEVEQEDATVSKIGSETTLEVTQVDSVNQPSLDVIAVNLNTIESESSERRQVKEAEICPENNQDSQNDESVQVQNSTDRTVGENQRASGLLDLLREDTFARTNLDSPRVAASIVEDLPAQEGGKRIDIDLHNSGTENQFLTKENHEKVNDDHKLAENIADEMPFKTHNKELHFDCDQLKQGPPSMDSFGKEVQQLPLSQVNLVSVCSQIAANICQYPTQS